MMNRNLGSRLVWKWVAAWSASALLVMLAIYGITSVYAQEPTPTPVTFSEEESGSVPLTSGDCWGGALSRELLHCYFLEEAQRAGKIEVAAVYSAPGGGPLYIFLRQTEPITDEVGQFFETKAHEYIEREFNAGRSSLPLETCRGYSGDERKACFNDALGNPSWRDFDPRQSQALPRSVIYEDILIKIGGPDGRRTVPGWASWSQVWPAGASGSGGASDGYDVSGVDFTNIPDPDCDRDFLASGLVSMSQSCHVWQRDRSLGIAALYTPGIFGPNYPNAVYVQLKVSDPAADEELRASIDRLPSDYSANGWELIVSPVKYDFGQLWRWSVILDRFAVSAGNTVGITGGQVTFNHEMYGSPIDRPIVWLNGTEPIRENESDSGWNWSTIRTILIVWAVDEERATAALPELLPALGIPADAVGLVAHDDATPLKVELAIGHVETVPTEANTATSLQNVLNDTEADVPAVEGPYSNATVGSLPSSAPRDVARTIPGVSLWTIVGGALVVILGAVLVGSLRMRRRSS